MAAPLLQLSGIALTFGGTPLLEGVDLLVSAGERVCLVGRNGSGKSTLLKIAAGLIESDSGTTFLKPDATIRYLPQEPDLSSLTTIRMRRAISWSSSDCAATKIRPRSRAAKRDARR